MLSKNTSVKNEGDGIYGRWKNTVDLIFAGKSRKERLIYPATAAFFLLISFLLCAKPLPYTTLAVGNPVSDALLCASSLYTPFVFLGNVIGAVFFGYASPQKFLTLAFIFVLRIITSQRSIANGITNKVFSESIITKLAVSAVMCFVQCGMFLAVSGINGTTAINVLATLISVPIITLAFSVYYMKPAYGRVSQYLYELSMLFLFSSIVYCSAEISFALCSLGTLLAVFFTLCVAKYGGFARGAIFGFVLGYIAMADYFLSFLLLGACASLIFSFGVFSACGISAAIACVCAIFTNGYGALTSFIPEAVIACAFTSPILRYSFLPKGFPYPYADPVSDGILSDAEKLACAEFSSCNALKNVSDNLRTLSESLDEITAPTPETESPAERVLNKVCSGFCDRCTLSPICLETELDKTRFAMRDMIENCLKNNGDLTESIPPYISSHCIKLRELTEHIRELCAYVSKEHPGKTEVPDFPLLLSYDSAAEILSGLAKRTESELVFDREAERAVSVQLHSLGISFKNLSVIGKKRKKVYIYGASHDKIRKNLPSLEKAFRKIFSSDYAYPVFGNGEDTPVIFSPAASLETEVAVSTCCKNGESVNGDTALTFRDGDGNFYALISDGMGSGASACKSSTLTAAFLKNLLMCNIDEKLAVRLTNEALPKLCDECFATVDLIKLDLINGDASVIKNYAATSYVLRNGSVYCCNASSLPLGINSEASPEEMSFVLNEGDVVIMVSDGIAQEPGDDVKIPDMLGLSGNLAAKEIADRILSKAIETKGKNDDMSAMVIKINKRDAA